MCIHSDAMKAKSRGGIAMKLGRIGLVPLLLILFGAVLIAAYIVIAASRDRSYYVPRTDDFGPPIIAILVGALVALLALRLRISGLSRPGNSRTVIQLTLCVLAFIISFGLLTRFEAMLATWQARFATIGIDCFVVPCPEGSFMPLSGTEEELWSRMMMPPLCESPAFQLAHPCVGMQTESLRSILQTLYLRNTLCLRWTGLSMQAISA
jgi:hypothetical protein